MELVTSVRKLDFQEMETATLFIYSKDDRVVNAEETDAVYKEFPIQMRDKVLVNQCGDRSNHVVAGDILSPDNTRLIADEVVSFITEL